MHVAPAELLGRDLLARRGLHERRAAEEDRPLVAHDDGLVAHRRDVRAAGGARPHDRGDLRDAGRRHRRLVEEDPAEVLAVGEDLVLQRQVRAAGVDEVDARQPVVQRHLLRAQVLLDRQREVRAALDRRVVGDDDDLAPVHAADAGDDPGRGRVAVVEAVRGHRRQLEQRRAGVEQALRRARARAACRARGGARRRRAPPPARTRSQLRSEVVDQRAMRRLVGGEGLAAGASPRAEDDAHVRGAWRPVGAVEPRAGGHVAGSAPRRVPVDRAGDERVRAQRPPEHAPDRRARRRAARRGRCPVSMPISCSIETRSSVAMLPVAPGGTGQPPSSPTLDSNDAQPACSAASTFARPCAARVVEVRGELDVVAERRARGLEVGARPGAGWPCRSCRRTRSPARRRATSVARDLEHALARRRRPRTGSRSSSR